MYAYISNFLSHTLHILGYPKVIEEKKRKFLKRIVSTTLWLLRKCSEIHGIFFNNENFGDK